MNKASNNENALDPSFVNAVDFAKQIAPMVFDNKSAKILQCLVLFPGPVSYSEIGVTAGIGLGSSLNHNLQSMMRKGLVYNVRSGRNSMFALTDAGRIAAEGLIEMMYRVLDRIRNEQDRVKLGFAAALQEDIEQAIAAVEEVREKVFARAAVASTDSSIVYST